MRTLECFLSVLRFFFIWVRTTGNVTETLQYHYDSNNSIIGFTYNGEDYLYLKNIQNDIIGIIDTNNNLVVEYNYDGYGNIISIIDNTTNKIGEKNPYRYRSYYYDCETSWYYLNSRYYNPNIGRFITMDEIEYLGATSTIKSYNLFAYCEGNPVNREDSNGEWPKWLKKVVETVATVATAVVSYVGMAVASIFDEDVKNDMKSIGWNPFNTDESKTLNSSKVSFYKGIPVFRTNMDRSGSFGAIFLSRGRYDSVGNFHPKNDPDELRHERGHITQLMMLGIGTYGFTVGIPSPLKLGPWAQNKYYYSPWETMADILSGVNQRYGSPIPQQQIKNAWMYYAMSTICSPLTVFYWL